MRLISPTGVRVSTSPELGEHLKRQGWRELEDAPAPAPEAAPEASEVKTRRRVSKKDPV
jgi:hypothetical protein